MQLKYVGLADERIFAKSDFRDLAGAEAVRFNAKNNWVAEVSDEVGRWLIENEAPEFREAEDDDLTVSDVSRGRSIGQPRSSQAERSTRSTPEADEESEGASASTGRGSTGRRRS